MSQTRLISGSALVLFAATLLFTPPLTAKAQAPGPNQTEWENEALKLRRAAWRPTESYQPATGTNAKPLTEQIASEAKTAHVACGVITRGFTAR